MERERALSLSRAVDLLSLVLLGAAAAAFSFGVYAIGEQEDLHALYWLLVGALLLKAAVDLLRPGRNT